MNPDVCPLPAAKASAPAPAARITGARRWLLLGGAAVCFALGVLGAVLPGLPATPFLLLTSWLLAKTSPRLNARLLKSRLFGPILEDWQRRRGIRRDVRLKAVLIVMAAVAGTLYFSSLSAAWKGGVAVAAAIGLIVVLQLPLIADSPRERPADRR